MKAVTILGILLTGSISLWSSDVSSVLKESRYKAGLRYYTMWFHSKELSQNGSGVYDRQKDSQLLSNAVGGYFGFETGSLYGISVGSTFYTSQPIFNNPLDEGGLELLREDQSGYGVLGEAYIKLEYEKTLFKLGRQLLSEYRFLSDNDIRMTPYAYEAAILENRDLENITLRAGTVRGVKTFTSTNYIDFVNASKNLFVEESVDRDPIRGDYNPAYYDGKRDYIGPRKNLYILSAIYNKEHLNLEFWNYYSTDYVNFAYFAGSYNFGIDDTANTIGMQLIKQDDIGEHVAGSINTYLFGAKWTTLYRNFILSYAFNRVKYDEMSLDGGSIIDTWGGNIIYNSLMYNGSDQAGTTSNTISIAYNFVPYDLDILLVAGKFDLPNKLTDIFADQDNCEYNLIAKYRPDFNKNLEFKIEASYIDFDEDYDFKAYEDMHGFEMLHTYDDIINLRFIVNYLF